MIELIDVSVCFGNFFALRNVSCRVEPGDFVFIRGHNGAGKSTLFDVICGRIPATTGKIFHKGKDITQTSALRRAVFMSRVFQDTMAGSVPDMTVAENLALATLKNRRAHPFKFAMSRFPVGLVESTLAPLNLRFEELLETPVGKLSGGQRQILSIVMATFCNPDLLLLDEPTAALDPVATENLLKFIENFNKNKRISTLMISHDENEVMHLANKIWRLEKGCLQNS